MKVWTQKRGNEWKKFIWEQIRQTVSQFTFSYQPNWEIDRFTGMVKRVYPRLGNDLLKCSGWNKLQWNIWDGHPLLKQGKTGETVKLTFDKTLQVTGLTALKNIYMDRVARKCFLALWQLPGSSENIFLTTLPWDFRVNQARNDKLLTKMHFLPEENWIWWRGTRRRHRCRRWRQRPGSSRGTSAIQGWRTWRRAWSVNGKQDGNGPIYLRCGDRSR